MSAEAVTPTPKVIEHPVRQEGIFDHRTHIRNSVTGRLVAHQPYSTHFVGDKTLMERPLGSGNMFTPHGEPAGRYEMRDGHLVKVSDTHTDISARSEVRTIEDENAALRAELAALKAETQAKTEAKPQAPAKK